MWDDDNGGMNDICLSFGRRSLLHIQWHIWKGHYSQAVSDFRFVKGHFECSSRSLFLCKDRRDDIENLKLVFRKKRPTK